jgi:predicted dehydrogenase
MEHRVSEFKVEGTAGAAVLTMGANLDYPAGKPDRLHVTLSSEQWEEIALPGSWFIEAFEGPMSNLQRFIAGEDRVLVTSVDDAIHTMALVEACYDSNSRAATPIPDWKRA